MKRASWFIGVTSVCLLLISTPGEGGGAASVVLDGSKHGHGAPRRSDHGVRSVSALVADLSDILLSHVRGGRWGTLVVSLSRGDTLYAKNPVARMQPASTLKLFTTGLSLDRFGPDHQLETEVLRDARVDAAGTVQGNLYLRG